MFGDREMGVDGKLPDILLVNRYANQMRHDFRQSMIVIALHPDHFNPMARIRKLADVPEKLPVLFRQAAKVEVAENVAQKDHALDLDAPQEIQRLRAPPDA